MSYGSITNKYKLKSPQLGDLISPDEERRNSRIIENQLFGAIRVHSGGNGVIRNGNFIVINGTTDFSVLCYEHKASGKPSIEAFINQIYVFDESTLEWSGLSNSTTYYLYVRLVETDDTTSSRINKKIQTSSNTTGVIPTDGLLVAIVHIDEPSNSIIVEDPVGKIEIPVLGDHLVDNQNPHTPYLYQDDLVVSGIEVLDTAYFRNLQIDHLTISGNSVISGNITVLGKMILSGNVCIQGNVTYNKLQVENIEVPGKFTVGEFNVTSGFDVYSTSTFRQNISLSSGITIDGFDPDLGVPLLDGSNVDHLHGHLLGSINQGAKPIFHSPEYCNSVLSGDVSGIFHSIRRYDNNYYQWFALTSGAPTVITRINLPQDFESVDRLKIAHGVGYAGSGNNITVSVFDKDNNAVSVTGGVLQSQQFTDSEITLSGGQLVPSQPMTIMNRMYGVSGAGTFLGDMTLWYVPVNGEKIVYTWNYSGSPLMEKRHFDGLRVAPCDLRIEKMSVVQSIGLSGATVIGANVGNAGSEPTTIFTSTSKPTLTFGDVGASYQSLLQPITENRTIQAGQIITTDLDLSVSGGIDLTVQMITHRL